MHARVTHDACSRRALLGAGLAGLFVAPRLFAQADEFGDAALRGAGSTLVQPLMEAWVRQFRADPFQVIQRNASGGGLDDDITNDNLDYEAVGSLAGIQRIRAGFVDFATSEMPLSADYLRRGGLMQFPWVLAGVAVVVNLGAVTALNLDATTLAAIYLGRITRWSDPAITALNPGVPLNDAPIAVLHRSDGSGSTFTFSSYLHANDADWAGKLGRDLTLEWPLGRGVNGGNQMTAAVRSTPNAIGYVGVAQAKRAGLTLVGVRNRSGRHVRPAPSNIAAAVDALTDGNIGFGQLPIDATGEQTYPLVATVFGLMKSPLRSARQRRTADFINWTITHGEGLARRLGYVSLPEHLAKSTLAQLIAT